MISIDILSRRRLRALPRNFSLNPKNPAPALQAIIGGLKKYSFCNPYDLFTICAIRRSVDNKQVLFCSVLETGSQRTLTSNPDQGHGSIPIGSWESSCSSEKQSNSCEADVDRVWDEGEGTRRGGGDSPRKRPGFSSSRFYRGEKLQISASLGVCRTESTTNPCWEPRILAIGLFRATLACFSPMFYFSHYLSDLTQN